jgi:spore photoproduct lyase
MLNGRTKLLVERVNDGSIIKRFDKTLLPEKPTDVVCPHFLELKWAYGCPYDCSWCYLKGTFRFHNGKIMPGFKVKDFNKIKLHVEEFLDKVDEPEILNTGELADSLMYENGNLPFSKFIIPMFEKQKKHKILFVTKSDRIKNLLEINSHNQVIISFSLNAIPVAERWEKGAPGIINRIESATKLSKKNYKIRIRIDPMVPVESWQKYYKKLIDLIFLNFIPERITLGSLRGLQSTLNSTKDNTWKKYLKETSGWGKKIDFETRLRMYLYIIGYLKKKYKYNKISLCKETKAMWQALKLVPYFDKGLNYTKIKCNRIL